MHKSRILILSSLLGDERLEMDNPAAVILRSLSAMSGSMADEMNDTANDGANSKCPTGDDYNDLSYLIDVAVHVLDQQEARERQAAASLASGWRGVLPRLLARLPTPQFR